MYEDDIQSLSLPQQSSMDSRNASIGVPALFLYQTAGIRAQALEDRGANNRMVTRPGQDHEEVVCNIAADGSVRAHQLKSS